MDARDSPKGSHPDSGAESLFERARTAGISPIGACFLALGAVLILAAFTTFNWFRDGSGFFAGAGRHSTFGQVHDTLEHYRALAVKQGILGHISFGAAEPYFAWLGWLLFVAVAITGSLAVSRVGGRHWWMRWLAAVIGATGVAVTFLALNLIVFEKNAPNNANAPTYSQFLGQSGPGAWAAITGFVLIIVAVLIPRGDI
jgi:hypothetical protein